MGAGLYSADRRSSAMHGRLTMLHEIRYGFSEKEFFLRVDMFPGALAELRDAEFRITLRSDEELRILLQARQGKLAEQRVEAKGVCLLGPQEMVVAACDQILEVSVSRKLVKTGKRRSLSLVIALWEGGLPVDLLPAEGWFEIELGADHFAWDP